MSYVWMTGEGGPGYLAREPESLVVRGVRYWLSGYAYGDIDCWEAAFDLYALHLGPQKGRRTLAELHHFIRQLRLTGTRPISFYPPCCRYLCRDECLIAGLVAAEQHVVAEVSALARRELMPESSETARENLSEAAMSFAAALFDAGYHLMPVPVAVLQDIVERGNKTHKAALH